MNYWKMELEKGILIHASSALINLSNELSRVSEDSSAGFKIRKVPEHLRTESVKALTTKLT